ncbi:MAG: hypothetical protein DMF56_19990 [Acidobacteria bacterium]|nr:MAG: hypothetical protein DMF56_19990 [Acidobacteriota bacterium]
MLNAALLNAAAGLVLTLIATPLVRAFARRIGAVAQPKADRWHQAPTAMMGGVAIYVAVVVALLLRVRTSRELWVVIGGGTALFVIGLVDDFIRLKPYQKLCGQVLTAAAVVYLGLVLPWTDSSPLNMLITFFWLVGVTNAVNMLDNMDGLSAGVAAIASLSLAINFVVNGQLNEALMLATFFGALAGFLVYNHNPASIFMGDCGSMFVGFFLASTALLSGQGGGRSRSVIAVLAVPVLVLCIPIFDTTFVTLARKLAGRSASQGGRDHTSHRLVALGLSERHAVWMLYAFAILGGGISIFVRKMAVDASLAVIAAFAIILGILGVYLAGVRVYSEEELNAAKQKPIVSFLLDLSYKRRIFEVALDVILIGLAYYAACAVVFGHQPATSPDWMLFRDTLPIIVFVKLTVFLAGGVYRGLWRYASLANVVDYVKAVAVSSVATILAMLFLFRFEGFSRKVFVIDGVVLLLLLTGSRFAFRVMRRLLPAPHARTGRRVLIFGAGDGGELLFRELRNNGELQYTPIAFIDDDTRKFGKFMHGLRVYSGDQPIADLCTKLRIEEVVLSTAKISPLRLREIVESCALVGVPVKRMKIDLERVADLELGWVLPAADVDLVDPAARIIAPRTKPQAPVVEPVRLPSATWKAKDH